MSVVSETSQPVVLLCGTMWWPLSARLAIAFVRHGCRVFAICPTGHPLRFVSGVQPVFPYKGLDSVASLENAIVRARPDLIVPCDDGVVWQLQELHHRNQELRSLIERSIGSSESFATIRSRASFLQAASELGIRIPQTRAVTSEADLSFLGADESSVLKLDGTWGGSGVAITHSRQGAQAAFRKLSRPMSMGIAWKRWLINRDPLALWSWRRREAPSVTVQQFVSGRPANTMFACWQGEVLAIVTVEVITAQGETGAATVVRIVRNAEIERAATLIAAKFQLNGFHGLDFVMENSTGRAWLIELNPRCTQLGHLRLPVQGELAGVMVAKLRNTEILPPLPEDCIEGETVAFFPQTFTWNPKSIYLRSGYHDVPWEEPALLRELLRPPWPERQLPSRIYHHFRVMKRQQEVKF
jgi:carbamoylphosphate synthase large subunit